MAELKRVLGFWTVSNMGISRAPTNQELYITAVKSLESLGGEEQVFLNSLKQLQRWILSTLFERYHEENRKNLMAINGLLAHFDRVLFEVDLLKDRSWHAEYPKVSDKPGVSLNYLVQIFCDPKHRKEDWLRLLGKCEAKDAAQKMKIAEDFEKEMVNRFKLRPIIILNLANILLAFLLK